MIANSEKIAEARREDRWEEGWVRWPMRVVLLWKIPWAVVPRVRICKGICKDSKFYKTCLYDV